MKQRKKGWDPQQASASSSRLGCFKKYAIDMPPA
jgi:hypothetical protein